MNQGGEDGKKPVESRTMFFYLFIEIRRLFED